MSHDTRLYNPTYITLSGDSTLQNERIINVAGGLTIQDNGANSTLVISASDKQPLDSTLTALASYNTNISLNIASTSLSMS